ncbi:MULTISPECIES: NADH-quinone oxidoreductase subunit C [Bacillus cereus group]|uniref:NADH-quinone oxidoreductase subunit C n=1 Tax=Bacillus cereus group TaxID=86661 RepID=UPI0008644AD4|nr:MULTISPECIES: NADH-quinone oxidoreductase subunit C [Bacillus cereus group]AWC30581.1 NADH-quinone oxidoreductase subunit C [Bacillus cytotoxicus]AWC42723.1 NADH-quinone oxidoreductase subunit C [Bacillus cytotoxicus]AWC50654.1 NADH-quinone oxidoreductase subunit C [Bacillus cytotoxicus]AWC54709.1 NADH-quinone oxidoreductase subunit C [Bacillus cytotoxicus]AWC58831.1 NADH-quinone oxidoreductase subunit C [Bacillus cytotoxicus]
MSDPNKELEDMKREAARRAKEEARKRLAAKHEAEISKIEAREQEKEKALSKGAEVSRDEVTEAEKKAAAAKAKAAALAKRKMKEESAAHGDEKAKAIAAAKAKAAAAARAKSAASKKEEEKVPEKPSPNQPYVEAYAKLIKEKIGEHALVDFYINRLSKDVPTLVVCKEHYYEVMELLRSHERLAFHYMSELHATDFVTHMEVYVHLYSYGKKQSVAVKVKLEREAPQVASITPLWEGANWPEREAYDLLGVIFTGHPNLTRILMPDDWVGHPLRKDYEPFDVEV